MIDALFCLLLSICIIEYLMISRNMVGWMAHRILVSASVPLRQIGSWVC